MTVCAVTCWMLSLITTSYQSTERLRPLISPGCQTKPRVLVLPISGLMSGDPFEYCVAVYGAGTGLMPRSLNGAENPPVRSNFSPIVAARTSCDTVVRMRNESMIAQSKPPFQDCTCPAPE